MADLAPALIVLPLALGACLATLAGGALALALRDRLHLVLGFSAGAVIGLAFFDLMPESLEHGQLFGARGMLALIAAGFFLYTILDRAVSGHSHDHEGEGCAGRQRRGWLGAGSFSIHSFLDGFVIGVAFQVSAAMGLVVAVAVLVHDFSDGLNTVNVVVKSGGGFGSALRWLFIDAAAPLAGAAVSLVTPLSEDVISVLLAIFSGFFLYIGASDLLPESHHAHPRFFTTLATFLGAAVLFVATRLAQ
jgi:zinc transporter ZupT